MKRILLLISAMALFTGACAQKPATNTATSTPAPSSSPAASKEKTTKKLPESKINPVPADWITMSDEVRGYEFKVPQGTQHKTDTVNGVDVYAANVPAPYDINVLIFAFKDKTLSKDDLMKKVEGVLQSMGEKDVKVTDIKELSDDYSLASISSVDEKGKATKGKVLVGTDVTDNYIVMIGVDADKFSANEKTIDEIWGSFGMYSGGYSGQS
jgi:CO dehydrogenase/acetyl-CoA synthase delta subunit